jgi:mRNA-degrading endonuclease RelE of RelBE toxin-antitoxin system
MKYELLLAESFKRQFKRLSKKYRSLKNDIEKLAESLSADPEQGKFLGKDCYKIQLSIASKDKRKGSLSALFFLPFPDLTH